MFPRKMSVSAVMSLMVSSLREEGVMAPPVSELELKRRGEDFILDVIKTVEEEAPAEEPTAEEPTAE